MRHIHIMVSYPGTTSHAATALVHSHMNVYKSEYAARSSITFVDFRACARLQPAEPYRRVVNQRQVTVSRGEGPTSTCWVGLAGVAACISILRQNLNNVIAREVNARVHRANCTHNA